MVQGRPVGRSPTKAIALIPVLLALDNTASAQTSTGDASGHLPPQPDTATNCSVGTWGISWATPPDGQNWTVAPTQQFPNTAGTDYECVAAHPFAVMDDDGDDIQLWFKGEQGTRAWATQNSTRT